MAIDETLQVLLADGPHARRVGRLRDVGTGPYFEFDPDFLAEGIELSPLRVPARAGVVEPGPRHAYRLRGLFADSIPDGFGLKVLHQALRRSGRDPRSISPLQLLAAVGDRGMGALCYRPTAEVWGAAADLPSLQILGDAVAQLDADTLPELPESMRRAAGTSGGARPKVTVALHGDGRVMDANLPLAPGFRPVLVKFRAGTDAPAHVPLEAAYLRMAAAAGLRVPAIEVVLLERGEQALVLERFDRAGDARRHAQTFAALIEADYRDDLVDYGTLLEATRRITRDYAEVEQALRLTAFNVLAGNRDDHIKNVSFVMEPDGRWRLAPAYDLTPSASAGYHAMSCDGESLAPGAEHVERVGLAAGLDRPQVRRIIDEVRSAIVRWEEWADAAGVPSAARREVASLLQAR